MKKNILFAVAFIIIVLIFICIIRVKFPKEPEWSPPPVKVDYEQFKELGYEEKYIGISQQALKSLSVPIPTDVKPSVTTKDGVIQVLWAFPLQDPAAIPIPRGDYQAEVLIDERTGKVLDVLGP